MTLGTTNIMKQSFLGNYCHFGYADLGDNFLRLHNLGADAAAATHL
jgi:hypothetical protein